MKIKKRLLICIVAIVLGLGSYYLINGWFTVVPWAIIAVAIGYFSNNRNDCLIDGAIFGYFLFIAYIFIGYQGKTDTASLLKFILFDIAFSLIGAAVGLAGGFGGYLIKRKLFDLDQFRQF